MAWTRGTPDGYTVSLVELLSIGEVGTTYSKLPTNRVSYRAFRISEDPVHWPGNGAMRDLLESYWNVCSFFKDECSYSLNVSLSCRCGLTLFELHYQIMRLSWNFLGRLELYVETELNRMLSLNRMLNVRRVNLIWLTYLNNPKSTWFEVRIQQRQQPFIRKDF